MQPHNLHLYFFSPTGGTKTVAGLFAEQLGAPDACTDITVHAEAKTFTADDRLLLFFPVYGGRVPEPCLARVRALRGADTPVTLVAVFGNRAVDDALLEMRDTLAPLGFRVAAAAAVIAPHSINTDIAAGRPDASDRAKIAAFCAARVQACRGRARRDHRTRKDALLRLQRSAAQADRRPALHQLRSVRG